MTVVAETLLKRVRKYLDDEPWEDYLTSGYTAASGTISVNQPTQWAQGDRMEADDGGGNILRVKVNGTTNPVLVKAAHNNTTDANIANGVSVLKNPEFEHDEILQAIQRSIDMVWPYGWAKDSENITTVTGVHIYPIVSTTFKELIAAVQDSTPTAQPTMFSVIRYGVDRGYPISILRDLPSSISASGLAIWVQQFQVTPANAIKLSYARLLSSTVSGGNFVDLDDGLMADMITYGACAVLLESLEIQRDADDVAQGDQPLVPGSRLRSGSYFRGMFEKLRWDNYLLLNKQEPRARVWER